MSEPEDYGLLQKIAIHDVATLVEKGKSYGASWRKRGGVGAFMMLARKWDRIEQQCEKMGYDIFEAVQMQEGIPDGLLDDIRDLRCYLLLVDGHLMGEPQRVQSTLAGQCPANHPAGRQD